ncbi:unnamed protein product [Camellia sinensis]
MPRTIEEVLIWCTGCQLKKTKMNIWNAILLTTLWSICKHINEYIFKGKQPDLGVLRDNITIRIAILLKASFKELEFLIHDFLFNIKQIRVSLGGAS